MDTVPGTELSDQEKDVLRKRFRAILKRATAVLSLAAFFILVLTVTVQSILVMGPKPLFFWVPVSVYLSIGFACFHRKKWLLLGMCALALLAHFLAIPKVGELAAGRGKAQGIENPQRNF